MSFQLFITNILIGRTNLSNFFFFFYLQVYLDLFEYLTTLLSMCSLDVPHIPGYYKKEISNLRSHGYHETLKIIKSTPLRLVLRVIAWDNR